MFAHTYFTQFYFAGAFFPPVTDGTGEVEVTMLPPVIILPAVGRMMVR